MTDKTNSISFEDSDAVKALDSYFQQKSTMEILGVDRDENAHSRFLAWLFENKETRDVAIKKLISLLKRTPPSDQDNCYFPSSLTNYSEDSFDITEVKVTLEDPIEVMFTHEEHKNVTTGTYYGRGDLVVELKLRNAKDLIIVVENKIDSAEHSIGAVKRAKGNAAPSQTVAYAKYYSQKYGKENCLFGYLTLTGAKDPEESQFIHFTYQDLLDRILIPLMPYVNDSEILFRLKDYMKCLEYNNLQNGVMAVGPNLAELVVRFWKKNKTQLIPMKDKKTDRADRPFLQQVFGVLEHVLTANLREDIKLDKTIIEQISKDINSKDYTRYQINGQGNYSKNALVYEVVRQYIEKHPKDTLEHLQQVFSYKLKGKSDALTNMVVVSELIYLSKKRECKNKGGSIKTDSHWKMLSNYDNNSILLFSRKQKSLVPVYVCQTGWDGTKKMKRVIKHLNSLEELKELNIEVVNTNNDNNKKQDSNENI